MSISKYPSKVALPQRNPGVVTVLEYLISKFPQIASSVWQQRVADGKVHWHDGTLISAKTPYHAQQLVYYYREVTSETTVPFIEEILFQDAEILVAYKPHFLAVTPGGIHVNECLQSRLRETTGEQHLQVLHRLDRLTAGLVLCSINRTTRHHYHHLFATRKITKTYHAVAHIDTNDHLVGQRWEIKNRIVRAEPGFRMHIVDGPPNSHSVIRCVKQNGDKALFVLNPITGKTHQLRLHMQTLGWPIVHDNYYPELQPKSADDFAQPLQLLAKELRFIDPLTQQARVFSCDANLAANSFG
jgi:tRNA pseudouridine32 synthase / 23S rRNA pseudouridine746 synthase